ncbi:BON domain-containing protein [Xanthomonas sp. AmX2]|uniref:BON domain-containing protein n=1 Tax=Xanthomonas sp. TaxID=29446 RepID=UPI00197DCB43|nr:BON domain-containing protein [Xanthomonas sp.]MBN6152848.1 BON domain-containing protein [Xanthomonas sp.]
MNTNLSRNLLAAALGLGMLVGAGQAFAVDPPKDASRQHDAMGHDSAKHDSKEPVTDSWITTKVKADLVATKDVPGTDIKVETVNGKVTLSGSVDNKAQREKAIAVTKKIDGVKNVDASGLKVAATAQN